MKTFQNIMCQNNKMGQNLEKYAGRFLYNVVLFDKSFARLCLQWHARLNARVTIARLRRLLCRILLIHLVYQIHPYIYYPHAYGPVIPGIDRCPEILRCSYHKLCIYYTEHSTCFQHFWWRDAWRDWSTKLCRVTFTVERWNLGSDSKSFRGVELHVRVLICDLDYVAWWFIKILRRTDKWQYV